MTTGTLSALIRGYQADATSIARISCAVVSSKVIQRTPRLSGSLANSWNANNGDPVANNVNISVDTPRPARNNATSVANSLQVGDKFSLANGQPYARRIEYEGWSSKRPEGMLRTSLAEWQSIVDGATRGS